MTIEELIVKLSAVKDLKGEVYIARYSSKLDELYPAGHIEDRIIYDWAGENCLRPRKILVIS